jgi:phage/plasmid-like protein (TIGR03299 family)
MAHEIDVSVIKKGGFVAYKQPAWHSLGTVLDRTLTFEDVLEHSGLDFTVIKAPNRHLLFDDTGNLIFEQKSKTSYFTARTDTGIILGDRVGKDYTILQNKQALAIADTLVAESNGTLRYDTAGSLKDGRLVWVLLAFDSPLTVGKADHVARYLLLASSHDGSMSLQARLTPVRVVCNNTLQASQLKSGGVIAIRHTAGAAGQLDEAARILVSINQECQDMTQVYNSLAKRRVTAEAFTEYVTDVMLTGEQKRKLLKGEDIDKVLGPKKLKHLRQVFEYATDGVGQDEAMPGSAWWCYNAITGYFSNVKAYQNAEHRMNTLMLGAAQEQMSRALMLATTLDEKPRVDARLIGAIGELMQN